MNAFTEVKTLLGHRNLAFSIECLTSFVNKSIDNIWLIIFGDGTLTNDDIKQIQISLPNCTIVNKDECEVIVLHKLAFYPACLRYRETKVYARKIFDLILYDNKDILYIDSDVYFLKKFILPEFTNIPVFMYDSENAYSFKPSEFIRIKFPIFPRVNSGFFFFPKEQFDLDYIELILSNRIINKGYLRGISWLEQTTWSFLASRHATLQYFHPQEAVMATEILRINEQTVCVHLVSTFRNHLEEVKNYARTTTLSTSAVPIRVIAAQRPLQSHHFYVERVIKRLRRYLTRFK